jgi:cell division protein FtsI (penicillin-binding protein 3)
MDRGEGTDGEGWASRRAGRRPAGPGGSRGPDRLRGQGLNRQAGADARGPGRGGAGRDSIARIGTGHRPASAGPRSGTGRGAAGPDRTGAPRKGAGRAASAGHGSVPNGSVPNGSVPNGSVPNGSARKGTGRTGAGRSDPAGRGASRKRTAGQPAGGGTTSRTTTRQRTDAALRAPGRARARMILRRRNPRHRLNATMLVIAVILSLFAGRLVQMQGLDWAKYRTLAQQQRTKLISVPTVRGSITTSDGTVLAMTVQTDQVSADPALIARADRPKVAADLAGPLAMPAATILGLLSHPPGPQYVLLKQAVSQTTAQGIAVLQLPGSSGPGLPGINLKASYARSYPNGDLAASLTGFTNRVGSAGDLVGEAGLEEQYNSLLAGRDGSETVETGTNLVPIPLTQGDVKAPVPSRSLRLTIQSSIQYEAEQQCKLRVQQTKARNCSIVVIQPSTGKILAIAQYPTYDPAQPASIAATSDIAAANVFAPGSTLKPITVAAGLEKGGQTPMTTYTVPAQINLHGFLFHDAELHPTLRFTVAGILANSLNDGMVQIVQHITPMQQYDYLRAFGLGSVTGLGLPGESQGLLPRPGGPTYWGDSPYEYSFGQGLGVTAVQMASIYATIANGGVRVQPSLVAGTTSSNGKYVAAAPPKQRRVISARTASELMTILQQVPKVDANQGEPWGLVAGYPVAAKTGTAQVSDPTHSKCILCQYGSSYIGIAPAQSPQLVVAVNVQDPRAHGYYGDQIAGPVFYHVMKFALQTLKIPPTGAQAPHIRLTMP